MGPCRGVYCQRGGGGASVVWSKGPVPSVVLFRTVEVLVYVLILEVVDMRRPIETNAVYFLLWGDVVYHY
jgi:hypothetical protein